MVQFYKEKEKINDYVTIVKTNEDGAFYRYMFSNQKYFIDKNQFDVVFERVEDETKNLFLNVLEENEDRQVVATIKKLGELQNAFCDTLIGIRDRENLYDRIADVEIMLSQMKIYCAIDDKALEYEKQKILKELTDKEIYN